MSRGDGGPVGIDSLATLVRAIYLERGDGVVEVRDGQGTESLFFRRGELFLDRDHATAAKVAPILASLPRDGRQAANAELRREVEELARQLARRRGAKVERKDARAMIVEVVGPLPTVCFVQELAVYGSNESELIARLGGDNVRLRSSDRTPALAQLPGLEPEMAQVFAGLEKGTTPAELVRGAGGQALPALRGLTKLWAVGLAAPIDGAGASTGKTGAEEVLTPKLLHTFYERIAEDLAHTPIDLTPEEHRKQLAAQLSRLGQSYYDLLGIEVKSGTEAVFGAYNRLARLVHPSHTRRLGLEGKEEASRVLFERATEAYLTLSDPRRRASYNTIAGIHQNLEIGRMQRDVEKRTIALQNYRLAMTCLAEMDFSRAVDLLKEAARMDPKAEYFARLGLAQSKNPHWRRHAVESYQRAIDLQPDDAGIRVAFGTLLEKMERFDEAREQLVAALDIMPEHTEALAALERLGGEWSGGAKAFNGSFRSLFKRGGGEEE